jgi:hypothetical protein
LVICVTSLAAVARCVLSRYNRADANVDGAPSSPTSSPAPDAGLFGGGGGHQHGGGTAGSSVTRTTTTTTIKGLKKRALKALPKLAYADAVVAAAAARGADEDEEDWWNKAEEVLSECAICLAEFGEWEEVRVMPQCGHGFHVACVDTWLLSNSSCPSCRRPIVIDDPAPQVRCHRPGDCHRCLLVLRRLWQQQQPPRARPPESGQGRLAGAAGVAACLASGPNRSAVGSLAARICPCSTCQHSGKISPSPLNQRIIRLSEFIFSNVGATSVANLQLLL